MVDNEILLAELRHLNKVQDELHQVIIGIKENPVDNGLIGDVAEILEHLKTLNGQVHTNTTFRKIGTWVSCALVVALLSILVNSVYKLW